jgi:hypothetical protein
MFSFTGTSACKKTLAMHGCAVRSTGFFLKPESERYKLEVSPILVSEGNFWAKK